MNDPNPSTTPKPYTPKHLASYYAARLAFAGALRRDDHLHTATTAHRLAASIAEALDSGRSEVDAEGKPPSVTGKPSVSIRLDTETTEAGRSVFVVDAQNRPVMIPAPKGVDAMHGQVPLKLYSGGALLAAQLSIGELDEREIDMVALSASLALSTRRAADDDAVRGIIAAAIVDVRVLSAEIKAAEKARDAEIGTHPAG